MKREKCVEAMWGARIEERENIVHAIFNYFEQECTHCIHHDSTLDMCLNPKSIYHLYEVPSDGGCRSWESKVCLDN